MSPDAAKEPITPQGLEALEAELARMEGPERNAMAERIKAARELGDLKENAEYHIAKDDQAMLETRILRLRERMRNAVVVEADPDVAAMTLGRAAEVLDQSTGRTATWSVVGSTEADPTEGRLSVESPVGRALLNTPVGESVAITTPRGSKTFVVQRLTD